MNKLIIHDETGFIISVMSGEPSPREPIGVPFLWVEIPNGKQLKITDGIGVDVSVTPHQVILEDRPPTIEEKIAEKEVQIIELKKKQSVTEQVINENILAQQGLLELLIDMGVL